MVLTDLSDDDRVLSAGSSRGVIAHTMNGAYGGIGFDGYMIGANYALAKNIVASLEWYDLKGKGYHAKGTGGAISMPEQDMETLWAQVVFTF